MSHSKNVLKVPCDIFIGRACVAPLLRAYLNSLLRSELYMLSLFPMKEEAKPWLEKAEENLDTAEYMFKGARYAPTCFMCQQTLEVLLKAAIIELTEKRHPRIHELHKLYEETYLPDLETYKDNLVAISKHYYQVRYPDFVKTRYNKKVAQETLEKTKELFLWIKNQTIKK